LGFGIGVTVVRPQPGAARHARNEHWWIEGFADVVIGAQVDQTRLFLTFRRSGEYDHWDRGRARVEPQSLDQLVAVHLFHVQIGDDQRALPSLGQALERHASVVHGCDTKPALLEHGG
jgi:hypothetical protein